MVAGRNVMLLFRNRRWRWPLRHCTNYPTNLANPATAAWQLIENKRVYELAGEKKPSVETTEGDLSERRLPKIAPCDHRGQL